MKSAPAIDVDGVSHNYGQRQALQDMSVQIERGEIFVLVGPNGGGKTTLFRLLSTLIPLQHGEVSLLGHSLRTEPGKIRRQIGVVFQASSLDKKLTVRENIRCQAALYGMRGHDLRRRETEMLRQMGLEDRSTDKVETLSGGLRRRAELAKGMIHEPQLLLLDEPSTGLDPGARSDLWDYLSRVRKENSTTIVLTSHLLEEAERADRIGILNEGSIVALDTPDALRATVGGDAITIEADDPEQLNKSISERFQLESRVLDGTIRLEQPDGHQWITRLVEAFPGQIHSITVGKPTLEDVFIEKTGHRFWQRQEST